MRTQQFLQSLTQKVREWRRRYQVMHRKGKLLQVVSNSSHKIRTEKIYRFVVKNILFGLSVINDTIKNANHKQSSVAKPTQKYQHTGIQARIFSWVYAKRSTVILVLAIVSLTGMMGHNLYNQPQLQVGTLSPQTFTAPYPSKIEDYKKTTEHRQAVTKQSLPILMVDTAINEQINHHLEQILENGQKLRTSAGSFPFTDTLSLSISTQRYLRTCSASEWEKFLVALENTKKQKLAWSIPPSLNPVKPTNSPSTINSSQIEFTQAVTELEAYRLTTSEPKLSLLISQILVARQAYARAITKLSHLGTIQPEAIYKETAILDLSDKDWMETTAGIHQIAQRILTQGIPSGLPPDNLSETVKLQMQLLVPHEAESIVSNILLAVLKPNLKKDEQKTQQQLQEAADKIQPFLVDVHSGAVIVNQGEKITTWQFEVLEHYHLIRRQVNWFELIRLSILVGIAVRIFVWVEQRFKCHLRQRDRILVLLLTLSIPATLAMDVPYTTWSTLGLLLGSFYGCECHSGDFVITTLTH